MKTFQTIGFAHLLTIILIFGAQRAIRADSQLLVPPAFTQQEASYIQQTLSLVVCNVAQAAGSNASVDLVKLITRDSNIMLHASPVFSWSQALLALDDKRCDILPWATQTETRLASMNFTRPYARIMRVIITDRRQSYIARLNDLGEKTVAIEKNNQVTQRLQKAFPQINFKEVDHTAEGLTLVANGDVFASIAAHYSVASLFRSIDLIDLKIAGHLPEKFDDVVSLATRKEDKTLSQILDKYIQTSDPSEIRNFMNQGAVFAYDSSKDYLKYGLMIFTVAIVFSLLLWWNRRLARLNTQLEKIQVALERKSKELEVLSVTDALTNTYNRVKIDRVFSREITLSERYQHALSIFMIDIDYFKNVNDTCGHWVGDQVLIKFAAVLNDNLRSNDFLGRWGGEEFLVICPSTSLKETGLVAEKLKKIIQETDFSPAKQITASFGVAEWKKGDSQESLVSKADYAMYLSKHKGRNRVTLADNSL